MQYHNYPTSEAKTKEARDIIRAARVKLMTKDGFQFYAQLIYQLKVKVANIGTMGTDGEHLYIDPQFVCGADPKFLEDQSTWADVLHRNGIIDDKAKEESLESLKTFFKKKTMDEILFVLIHEVRHIVHATRERGQGLHHALVNKAADYQINNKAAYELHKSLDKAKQELPLLESCLTSPKYFSVEDNKYSEWTMEQIYSDLLQEQKNKGCPECGGKGNKDENGNPQECSTCGSDGTENGNGEGEGYQGSFDVHLDVTEEQAEKIKNSIISAGKLHGHAGTPSDIMDVIDEWTKPKINWSRLLDRTIKSMNIHDLNYQQPNPRSWSLTKSLRNTGALRQNQYMIQPSYTRENTVEVFLAFDMSGSINDEVKMKILNEVAGIMKQYTMCKLHLCCWDTSVYNYQVYDQSTLTDLKHYQLTGGGGTDVDCVLDFIRDNNIKAASTAIFTDGYFSTPTSMAGVINPIWIIFDNPNCQKLDGKTVHYVD